MNTTPSHLPAAGRRVPGTLLLVLAMVTVGSTVVASRLIAAGLPPFTAAALRFAIALPIFLALMRLRGERWPRPGARDAALLLLQGLCGSVGYAVLLTMGMRTASAADAGIIAGSLPAVVALAGMLLLRERIQAGQWLAIGLASAGVVAIQLGTPPAPSTQPSSPMGDALVFAAVVCEALFLILNRRLGVPVAALPQSALMCGLGLAFTCVPALFEHAGGHPADATALLGVVYYALVPTVGGYLLWYAGLERVGAGRAAMCTAVLPVSAVALAALVLKESISAAQLAGAAFVMAAIVVGAAGARRARR